MCKKLALKASTTDFHQRMWKGNTVSKAFSQLYSRNYGGVLFPESTAEAEYCLSLVACEVNL